MTAATATVALAAVPPAACCPSCGFDMAGGGGSTNTNTSSSDDAAAQQAELLAAQARIQELESHVRQLNIKATAAVERWAGYEAELAKLRSQQQRQQQQQQQQQQQKRATPAPLALSGPSSAAASPSGPVVSPTRASFLQSAPGRLSALLYPRKSTPNLRGGGGGGDVTAGPAGSPTSAAAGPTSTTTEGLLEALTREQALRREAEGRLSATSREVEELSVSLFEQANEMVAEERRARARLEERVGELERRDAEKRRRLERLEGAMGRIERVRDLLEESTSDGGGGADEVAPS
ncbi:hypothetical protein JDV02_005166 [Purpureocillium takamizusanense]|uniref:GDP/GTP exchange factor Sec2 N-terminal domain-containing protein n=1 Tax=Purpureocillium takamizusanense TaxID=2060973 RepID=A0A9Q8QHV5_9HYPO|nr:uncharacterized protein JDV02_005166 [Purpureocillium takamizusanense]UNI18937.1 hypothetical protein JDV02_005166 [Purpureocillium takamizusanense]